MNDRLLKRLILEMIEETLNEGRGTLKDEEALRFSDLVSSAADSLNEAHEILVKAKIIGTLVNRVEETKEELDSLVSQVSSDFGSGFNPYRKAGAHPYPGKQTPHFPKDED